MHFVFPDRRAAFGAIPLASASEVYSGTDRNITWHYQDGVLTLSGEYEMNDYSHAESNYSPAPWHQHKDTVASVVIEDGVKTIGNNAFKDLSALTSISIPESVTSIGAYAFSGCTSLKKVIIPASVSLVKNAAFASSSIENLLFLNPDCEILFTNWGADLTFDLCLCDRTLGYTQTAIIHTPPTAETSNVQKIATDHNCYYHQNDDPANGNSFHACTYVDNGDGSHRLYCADCDEVQIASIIHTFTNGVCACGQEKPTAWEFDDQIVCDS